MKKNKLDKNNIFDLHFNQNKSVSEIAVLLRVDYQKIYLIVKNERAKRKLPTLTTANQLKQRINLFPNHPEYEKIKQLIINKHFINRLTYKEIELELNVKYDFVKNILDTEQQRRNTPKKRNRNGNFTRNNVSSIQPRTAKVQDVDLVTFKQLLDDGVSTQEIKGILGISHYNVVTAKKQLGML
jgi:predicted DNA-binding protein YlxM (UPF0122 family)